MSLQDYFTQIMQTASLSLKDRESLRIKRGFTDDVIDKLQFKSCGPELVSKLKGIPIEIKNALAFENILIPYLSADNQILSIRPHKFGIKDNGIQVYIPFPLLVGKDLTKIVIAESEFKAVASCMLGVPAVGIPGIHSFKKNKFPQLIEVLTALGVKKTIICFDKEIKDNPKYPNFKNDWTKRYDTEIMSYIMAYNLEKAGFISGVAQLRNEWMQQGKADIDGILANKVQAEDYIGCIEMNISAKEYRSSWKFNPDHLKFVNRKIDQFFYNGKIQEEFNCYIYRENKRAEKITNFKADIVHTLKSNTGHERLIYLEDQYNNSTTKTFTPELMVSRSAFQKFLYECGDYQFQGNENQFSSMWEYILLHQEGKMINRLKHYGYDDDSGIWFFANGAYKDGVYYPKQDDIYWVQEQGFKLPENLGDFEAPFLISEKVEITIKDIQENLGGLIGRDVSKIILAWVFGNFFMPEILKEFKNYPFLFFHGKFEEGKSTISNWLTCFFGYTKKGVPFAGSTAVGIRDTISQLSMIPLWLEEYRNNDPNLINKNNLLRSVYDRSTLLKGQKLGGVKSTTLRSSLIISGEEHPVDAALISRCMLISLQNTKNRVNYDWMVKHQSMFNAIGHDLLLRKNEIWPIMRNRIKQYISAFESQMHMIAVRAKMTYSMMAGIWESIAGETEGFIDYIGRVTTDESKKISSSSALSIFLDDIYNLKQIGKINFEIVKLVDVKMKNGNIQRCAFLWLSGAYAAWELHMKKIRMETPHSKGSILDMMMREPYFIRSGFISRLENKQQRGVLLTNCAALPNSLKDLLTEYQNNIINNQSSLPEPLDMEEVDERVEKEKN